MATRRTTPSIPALVRGGIAAVAAILTLVALAWRMRRGFDWTDEAFYLALPARFAMGDRPFVDELNVGQNAGIFLWPFLRVYYAINGWTGVFAFIRFLYVVLFAGVGWSAFALGRACRLALAPSILVGATCLCFMPYGLPGLGYNTLGIGFVALGLLGTATVLVSEQPLDRAARIRLVWAGFALGVGAFSYPTFVLSAVAAAVAVALFATDRVRSLLLFCGGGLAVGLVLSPVFAQAGLSGIRAMVAYSFADAPASTASFAEKLRTAWTQFQNVNPGLWKDVAFVGLTIIAAKRLPRAVGIFLPLLPLLVRVDPGVAEASMSHLARFTICGALFAVALEKRRLGVVLFATCWAPAFIAGFAAAVSSGNGGIATGIGFYPGAIVSVMLFALWANEVSRGWSWPALRPLAELVPLLYLWDATLYIIKDDAVYRDGPLHLCTAKMTSGPYKGLYTTPHRKRWLDAFEADIRRYRTGARTSFWYDFPAGYLYAALPPHTASVWNFPWTPRRAAIEAQMLSERLQPNEIVFRLGGMTHGALDQTLTSRAKQIGSGDGYSIWQAQ